MQQSQPTIVTLVLGGVRSGKSRYAQQIAAHAENVTFVATAERRDDAEMHAKIERQRADRPAHWTPRWKNLFALGRVVQTREDILKGSLEGGHR